MPDIGKASNSGRIQSKRILGSVKTNPGIDHADEHIHSKIDSNDDRDREQRNALDGGVITIANRVDHQAAKAWPIEYRFRDDGATQQRRRNSSL